MENQLTSDEASRALELLDHIESNPDISQATLANELGVAVGTINWHIKRLVSKGYIKVKRAQRKKLRYILTPEGIALRASLTVDYIRTSFDLYRRVRERAAKCIEELRYNGYTRVRVEGSDDVAEIIKLTCLEQGIALSSELNAPEITIQGIKLALILPDGKVEASSLPADENRGEHGPTA